MARKKLEKMADELNEAFRDDLPAAMLEKYGMEVITTWNFISQGLVTVRRDGQDFTPDQMLFVEAYEAGYLKAMSRVQNAA